MSMVVEPLVKDEYTGEPPTKRVLAYLQAKREKGARIAGVYCGYAPVESIRALGIVPAALCAFSNATIEAAEAVLPANLCPLIKSSYGFIVTDTCPFYGISDAGCPIAGDVQKVFHIIEEAGGVIVALDACSGFKPYASDIQEDMEDPVRALSERYLKIPCSCMTPNGRRLTEMTRMIEEFKVDAVIDVVLQACHSYNIESYKVGEHVQKNHGLPFLKLVTDFSQSDVGQLRTRVEALLEMVSKR